MERNHSKTIGRWGRLTCLPLLILAGIACNFPGFSGGIETTVPTPNLIGAAGGESTQQIPSVEPTEQVIATLTEEPTITYTPTFEESSCEFYVPPGYDPTCGFLTVPEDRSNPNTRMIRLHVAIFHSTNPNHAPDPVIQLSGGPGSNATDLVWYHFQQGADRFLDDRDFIFFDQRGTGHSEPALTCPEREDASITLLTQDLTLEQQSQLELQSMEACHDRLIAEGVDLTSYNSAASAADINDLRVALGYQQINLFGVSYGTRLALTVMRDNPGILRSVILDSVYPPQFNLYTSLAPNTQRALDVLFNACASDASCSSAFPDLEAVFYQTVDALNASPMRVPVTNPNTKQPISVVLNGDLLVDLTATAMYRPIYEGKIPRMIYDLQRGYANPFLESRLELYFDRSASRGMTFSVQCHEEIPFDTLDAMTAEASTAKPQIAHNYLIRFEMLFQLCDMWGAGVGDAVENQPVTSSVPTLIYAGRYDPITPPAWGQIAGQTLDHSYYYEFPEGHWVMRSDSRCPVEMAAAFLNNPMAAPDGSCIAEMGGIPFSP